MNDSYTILDHLKALKLDMVNVECSLGYLKQRVEEIERAIENQETNNKEQHMTRQELEELKRKIKASREAHTKAKASKEANQ